MRCNYFWSGFLCLFLSCSAATDVEDIQGNEDNESNTDTTFPVREVNDDAFPSFTWDSLPVALHFSNYLDYTDEELKFMSNFPLITIEKNQGFSVYQDVRKGTKVAVEGIRKYNPKAKLLFYWNSRYDNCENYFGKGNNLFTDSKYSGWMLRNDSDTPIVLRGLYSYDHSVKDCREWWTNFATEAVDYTVADGCYIDALQQYYDGDDKISDDRYKTIHHGIEEMLSSLSNSTGKDKLLIFNNIFPLKEGFDSDIYKYSNGFMIEHFCTPKHFNYTPDEMVNQIESIRQAGKDGRIVIAKAWPRYYFRRNNEYPTLSNGKPDYEKMIANAREDIVFPLACFLVGAGKYAYFCYSWGWNSKDGGLYDYEEYHKSLGEPKGDALRQGYVYTRNFKHAKVWVDLQKKLTQITWLDK